MNIKIFDKNEIDDVIYLKLLQIDGGVDVIAVDDKGVILSEGHLLFISKKGVMRYGYVNDTIGFDLTDDYKLKDILE